MGKIIQFDDNEPKPFTKDLIEKICFADDAIIRVEDANGIIHPIEGAYYDGDKNTITIYI